MPHTFSLILALIFNLSNISNALADQINLELSSGDDISVEVYGTASDIRVLWIGSGFGLNERHHHVAKELGQQGLQVWQTDLIESLFMVRGAEAMREIKPAVVAELIEKLSENGKYKILLVSGTYGAIPTLRGAHAWQATKPKQASIIGAVLFSPMMFTHVPDVGETPEFIAVTKATSIPLYIFQAEKAGNRWHTPVLVEQLNSHAPVYTELLKGVTSLFFPRDEAPQTLEYMKTIATKIKNLIPKLATLKYPLEAIALAGNKTENKLGLNDKMKIYRGGLAPMPFSLVDVKGKKHQQTTYKGKVRIINFWATWCPPCVEEIPSLNRLREKMQGKAFELISIDYGESAEQINKFMQQVSVDFPVLLDPDGSTAGQWKVVSFPSTFVIGTDGKIKYGVNAAIHWDTEEVVSKLNALLP
ncbi:MAG: TlpA family protein disulfide reductase [Gammaproteobacteria bacterium]|nr:TlpA family protein disulfide reductase [Gammaproteobacteria bacterium]MDH5727877.1 TlpA family protein disulfide reductase [Gammaproteobacteria bacterium]